MVERQSPAQKKRDFMTKYQILCSCQQENVYFICTSPGCTDMKQTLFCEYCLSDGKHQHFPQVIIPDYILTVE